jgi:hypothetical protein
VIAPNTPPTWPANPRWLWLLINCLDEVYTSYPEATMMLGFIPDSDPNPGDDPDQFINEWALQFQTSLCAWFPETVSFLEWGFYWQTARGLQIWESGPSLFLPQGLVPGNAQPGQINCIIRKQTARYPLGKPWFRIPFPPMLFRDANNVLNNAGMASLSNLATQLNTNLTSQGHQFSPASWSSKSNLLEPILSTIAKPNFATILRRGALRTRGYGLVFGGFNWSY